MGKQLYRISEAGEIIGRCRSEVYELLENGDLTGHNPKPGKKGLRVTAKSIEAYLEKHKLPAKVFLKIC